MEITIELRKSGYKSSNPKYTLNVWEKGLPPFNNQTFPFDNHIKEMYDNLKASQHNIDVLRRTIHISKKEYEKIEK